MEQKGDTKGDGQCWFILRHPNPMMIDDIFSKRKQVSLTEQEQDMPLPHFEYFIPFCDMQFRPSLARRDAAYDSDGKYQPKFDGEALRSDLHSFVFIYGDEALVDAIISRSWNRALKSPLWAYRNRQGGRIRVSTHQMNLFRNAIRQMDFQICEGVPATAEIREGDKVLVTDGPMAGGEGIITEIREREGQLSLTVAFNLFDDKFQIAVPGISIGHVQLLDADASRLLTDSLITNFETELIELLCHRHGAKGSTTLNKDDRRHLRFLYRYSAIQFDSETSTAQFAALMLICAYLLNDKQLIAERRQEVQSLLGGVTEPETDLQCYLMTALFIATHDVTLRQRVKAYRQAHADCALSVRRFVSIAKKISCRH